jgi:hypothetical protein
MQTIGPVLKNSLISALNLRCIGMTFDAGLV